MSIFVFILLFLLNWPNPNLATPPYEFITQEMEKFIETFKMDIKNYANEKILKVVGEVNQNNLQLLGGNVFTISFQILEDIPKEIGKMKKEIIKYLGEENGNYEEIVGKLDKLKIDQKRMNALKDYKKELEIKKEIEERTTKHLEAAAKLRAEVEAERGEKFEGNIGHEDENKSKISTEKQLELVREMLGLLEQANEFLNKQFFDRVKMELQIRMPFGNYLALEEELKKEKAKMDGEIGEIFGQNEKEIFNQIEAKILTKKIGLKQKYRIAHFPSELPKELEENVKMLKRAISNENKILEKLNLKEMSKFRSAGFGKVVNNIQQIGQQIDKDVDEIPGQIMEAQPFFWEEKGVDNNNVYTILFLNSASSEMYKLVKQVISEEMDENEKNKNLSNIHWLRQLIAQKLRKIYKVPILDLKELKENELPKKWYIEGENEGGIEEGKTGEMTILSARNMLFIDAKLEQIYDVKNAIEKARMNLEKVKKLVHKGMMSGHIGQSIYAKYLDAHKASGAEENPTENVDNAAGSSFTSAKKEIVEKMAEAKIGGYFNKEE